MAVPAAATNYQKSLGDLLHDPQRAEAVFRKVLRQGMFVWMVTSYVMRGTKGAKRITLLTPLRWFFIFRIISRALQRAR